MNSVSIWEQRWRQFKKSSYSSGSAVPAAIAETYHIYEDYLMNRSLNFTRSMKVLDIGAGSGRWTLTLAPKVAKVVAIEPTSTYYLLKKNTACFSNVFCHKKSFGEFICSEIFDLVIISGVLTYIHDDLECNEFLSKALKMVSPEGHLFLREPVGRKVKCNSFNRAKANGNMRELNYLEISRPKEYYHDICQSNGFGLIKSVPVHATVLYKSNLPVINTILRNLMSKMVNRRHLTSWYLYNACFSKPEAFIRLVCNIPKIHIMIYKNITCDSPRNKATYTKQLEAHVDC